MKTVKKIDLYFNRILGIRFENENGGAYAYIQYLAFTRELLTVLRPLKKAERQLEALEGINWLFNEHLAFKFTPRHKVIFEEKMNETEKIFDAIRMHIKEVEFKNYTSHRVLHSQAA